MTKDTNYRNKYQNAISITPDQVFGVVLGHTVGDALGVPAEFTSRKQLSTAPITDMVGFGTYNLPAGTWSDDSSMAFCTLDSLAKGKVDFDDVMHNFALWVEKQQYTPHGEVFDIGRTCLCAIINHHVHNFHYTECGEKSPYSNGNGSLMRIYPFVLYLATLDEKMEIIHTASALTHAHERSKIACGIYAFAMWELLKSANPSVDDVKTGLANALDYYSNLGWEELSSYTNAFAIAEVLPSENAIDVDNVKSSGYVVDTLEATLFCLLTTQNYCDCVLKAVNLGEDTDTIAAIAGSLAGLLYGVHTIPETWKNALVKKDWIDKLTKDFYKSLAR